MIPTLQPPPVSYPADEFAPVLTRRLGRLSYPAFAYCVGRVLLKLGYRRIEFSDRRFDRGRTHSAGIDFTASLGTPLGSVPIGGQFKRYERIRVSRQHVAVLTAAMRRRGLAQAIMINTGEFSGPARDEAASDPGRPVRLMAGRELARVMMDARIGCLEVTDWLTGEPHHLLDERFFDDLERRCRGGLPEPHP